MLAEVEKDISDMFIEAAHAYREDDLALQLRMMSLVNESVKEAATWWWCRAPTPRLHRRHSLRLKGKK